MILALENRDGDPLTTLTVDLEDEPEVVAWGGMFFVRHMRRYRRISQGEAAVVYRRVYGVTIEETDDGENEHGLAEAEAEPAGGAS